MQKIYYQEDCNLSILDGKTIAVIGYGSTRPLAPNDTEEHRALNRRTEMVVVE